MMQDVVTDLSHWPPRAEAPSPPPAPAPKATGPAEPEPQPASTGLRWRPGGK